MPLRVIANKINLFPIRRERQRTLPVGNYLSCLAAKRRNMVNLLRSFGFCHRKKDTSTIGREGKIANVARASRKNVYARFAFDLPYSEAVCFAVGFCIGEIFAVCGEGRLLLHNVAGEGQFVKLQSLKPPGRSDAW